jgi:hypothetical protein
VVEEFFSKMALLIDKYKPINISQLDFNVEIMQRLKSMIMEGDFPHLLFYGPRRIYSVPQSITGLVEPGKKNPTIFFFCDLFLPGCYQSVIDSGLTTFRFFLEQRKILFLELTTC